MENGIARIKVVAQSTTGQHWEEWFDFWETAAQWIFELECGDTTLSIVTMTRETC